MGLSAGLRIEGAYSGTAFGICSLTTGSVRNHRSGMTLWTENHRFWGRALLVVAAVVVVWLCLRWTCGAGNHPYCGDIPAESVYK